jgi:8-oxo-dGTP pyrophosphatase MutT (NUDIX family)
MSDRNQFIESLEEYAEKAEGEQATFAERMLGLARTEPRATHRDCFPAHLTASALITDDARERVLLCHHRKLNKWLQLGGHADGSWNVAQAAFREAEEESGLTDLKWDFGAKPADLDIHLIPARGAEPEHWHFDVRYLLVAPRPESIQVSAESLSLRWVDKTQAYELAREPALHRMFDLLWKMP